MAPMAPSDASRSKDGRMTEELGVEFVCCVTQSLYRSRKSLREKTYENCLKSGKRWLRRTLESAAVRQAIGASPQQWFDINQVFYLAIPALEVQSIPSDTNVAGATTSSALMTLNYDTLMKDLERLNDILLIARNCLATTQRAQNLAGESLLDQQVLKLIDLCVRVTARGYDGETPSRAEKPWANVIGACEFSILFLHNFIMKNEQRKLLLWLDLFANSKVANEYALPVGMGREQFEAQAAQSLAQEKEKEKAECDTGQRKARDRQAKANDMTESIQKKSDNRPKRTEHTKFVAKLEQLGVSNWTSAPSKPAFEDIAPSLEKMAPTERRAELLRRATRDQDDRESKTDVKGLPYAGSQKDILFGAVKTERGDEFGALRTPQSAAVTLQVAKDQLMARLAGQPLGLENQGNPEASSEDANNEGNGQATALSEEEDDYREHEPGDQQRGLLTDIPLVLGPQEIEALPMIIQIGICPGLGTMLHGRDMQGMRCNILLAGEAGRNLLRELLIFIAAWDLQDDEVYFRLMMQIMEAILENGLMPYAYQTFSELKDIVSPAQSMVIKILTQIFRGKQTLAVEKEKEKEKEKGKATAIHGKGKDKEDVQSPRNPHADASRRVDIYIVRYIFTIFRSSIIPETCALIYLQGQIKAGAALPEDFPLNLWDMERVYEGVYQFLEFFAVLTESEEWKELLVNWEVVSELVTLLRELEASIPKAPITSNSAPHTMAEVQAVLQNESQKMAKPLIQPPTPVPAPVAVERPFDVNPNIPATTASQETYPPLPATNDLSEQESVDSTDPSDFEWRNLKKLVILVLSSLVWKSSTVQSQIRQYGGVEMVLACCSYDANNPYIREHAVMCLRFLLEGSGENKAIVAKLQELGKMPPEEVGRVGEGTVGAGGISRKRGVVEGEVPEERTAEGGKL
ncbi:MAG: hypothetical protein Q9163_005034 [Psora crenata]